MIHSLYEAKKFIFQNKISPKIEEIPLSEALNRVLAQNIQSVSPVPSLPISLRDGYALRSKESYDPLFKIIGRVTAGEEWKGEIGDREAVKIMTGAPIPQGTDAVIELEKVQVYGEILSITEKIQEGHHIAPSGSYLGEKEEILEEGRRINPLVLSLLASLNQKKVKVYQKPRISILTTGDELISLGEEPLPGQILNSNSYLLMGLVEYAGGLPVLLERVRDTIENLQASLERGIEEDLLITTGGLGRGDHDYLPLLWERLGIVKEIETIKVRPGKKVLFGLYNKKPIFSLPGSPGALLVLFCELIKPLISRMEGQEEEGYSQAILTDCIENKKEGIFYVLAGLKEKRGRIFLKPFKERSWLRSLPLAQALLLVPERRKLRKGDEVSFLPLRSFAFPYSSLASKKDL